MEVAEQLKTVPPAAEDKKPVQKKTAQKAQKVVILKPPPSEAKPKKKSNNNTKSNAHRLVRTPSPFFIRPCFVFNHKFLNKALLKKLKASQREFSLFSIMEASSVVLSIVMLTRGSNRLMLSLVCWCVVLSRYWDEMIGVLLFIT